MSFSLAALEKNHDLSLPPWGPYSKKSTGISHIPDPNAGLGFDVSFFPALYRRGLTVPNVLWESGYHPWEAAVDLSYFSYRHELVWKDRVYSDVSYGRLDSDTILIAARTVNNTDHIQGIVFHHLASLHYPPVKPYSQEELRSCKVILPPGWVWQNALDYHELILKEIIPSGICPPTE